MTHKPKIDQYSEDVLEISKEWSKKAKKLNRDENRIKWSIRNE